MHQELRGEHHEEGKAERNGGQRVQDVAQLFVKFKSFHGEISISSNPPRLANTRKIGMHEDFLGQVFASEVKSLR